MTSTVQVASSSSGIAPIIPGEQLLEKPGVTYSALPNGMSVSPLPMMASKPGQSVTTYPTKVSNASQNMLTSSTKVGTANLPTPAMEASKVNQKLSASLGTAGDVNTLPTSATAAGKSSQNSTISSSTSPSKGLTEEAKSYLTRWLTEHSSNPYPSREEKNSMISLLGIGDAKKLEGW